jgi:tripartite-type tricarboxylate transporter receptor subunit TctC
MSTAFLDAKATGWLLAAVALTLPLPGSALGQTYPTQTVRIVVPFAAGGTTDLLARLAAEGLRGRLGQPVIVDNKPGAGGNIGAAEVVRSAPDGHTLLLATPGPLAVNQYIYANPGYDAEKQLVGVTNIAIVPNVLLASHKSGIGSVAELVKKAKEKPGALNFGSAGVGSTSHLSVELLSTVADIKMVHVPYRGISPAMTDLFSGQIDLLVDNLPTALPMIEDGRVKAIGITVTSRADSLPDVPTIAETLPGFDVGSWFGLVAPAGTPKPVLDKIAAAVRDLLAEEATRVKVIKMGGIPDAGTPEKFDNLIKQEQRKFRDLIAKANIKP